jgi:uncharacterized protein (TIGR04255 family)
VVVVDGESYKTNYLTDVIFEVKFPPILELIDGENSHVSKFQKILVDEFPYLDIKRGEEVSLRIDNNIINDDRIKITIT